MVVPAVFGGPMQSKFRLFVGSLLLFALSACGQGAPTAPASTVAATGAVPEGSAAGSGSGGAKVIDPYDVVCGAVDIAAQHGDGVYAVRALRRRGAANIAAPSMGELLGFAAIRNNESCPNPLPGTAIKTPGENCENTYWMIVDDPNNGDEIYPRNGKFPITQDGSVAYCWLGDLVCKPATTEFETFARDTAKLAGYTGTFNRGFTATFADPRIPNQDTRRCKESGSGSGSGEPK